MKLGQSCFVRKDDVMVVRYEDKKAVHVLSTKMTAGFTEKTRCMKIKTKDGPNKMKKIHMKKPSVIDHYNGLMGAVDATDQVREKVKICWTNFNSSKQLY